MKYQLRGISTIEISIINYPQCLRGLIPEDVLFIPQINKEPVMRDTPFKCLPHGAIGVSTSGNIWNLLGNLNDVQNTLKSTILNAQPFGFKDPL